MDNILLTNLEIACMVLGIVMSILMIWYIWRMRDLSLTEDPQQRGEEEEHETDPLLLENPLEKEAASDLQEETAPNNPEHPTNS